MACTKFTVQQVNQLLVPRNLAGQTQAQQCAFIRSNSAAAQTFRRQAYDFLGTLYTMKKIHSRAGVPGCKPAPWRTTTNTTFSGYSLIKYLDAYTAFNTGFGFILKKTLEEIKCRARAEKYRKLGNGGCYVAPYN
jgi:hypothetical protein